MLLLLLLNTLLYMCYYMSGTYYPVVIVLLQQMCILHCCKCAITACYANYCVIIVLLHPKVPNTLSQLCYYTPTCLLPCHNCAITPKALLPSCNCVNTNQGTCFLFATVLLYPKVPILNVLLHCEACNNLL